MVALQLLQLFVLVALECFSEISNIVLPAMSEHISEASAFL